ncbi:MAG: YhfC family intramembrane metalloprotease [Deltaproteobacteria bacterium]|nr:YhfC family intramembrane metalloprotease [Deltaproteobacteria bacterium]
MNNVTISIIPAVGMMIVASAAVIYWRRVSKLQFRWFWLGAGLWTIAVALKAACALLTNKAAIVFMSEILSYPLLILGGGLFIGFQSSFFEIGLTLLAVLIWHQIGRDANRAIGIGIGVGAFEAMLLGIASLTGILAVLAGIPGTEKIHEGINKVAAVTPLFWLVGPAERISVILCHASSRALVLLGARNRKTMMVFWGFLIFTLLDGVAGAAHISGKIGTISMWWIELAILPFALISIPILRWCYASWNKVR